MRIVRARAGRVLGIGALHAQVGGAQRVDARGANGFRLEPSSQVADSRVRVRRRRRRRSDPREIDLQLCGDVRDAQNPRRLACRCEHLGARTGMVAGDRRPRRPVDTGRGQTLSAVRARGAQPVLGSRARLGPQLSEFRGAIRSRAAGLPASRYRDARNRPTPRHARPPRRERSRAMLRRVEMRDAFGRASKKALVRSH